jgi:hypothetical protein
VAEWIRATRKLVAGRAREQGTLSRQPIDIATRKPRDVDAEAAPVDAAQQRKAIARSRLDAKFMDTRRRIHRELAELDPEILGSALNADSRLEARVLIAEVRTWLDAFEHTLRRGGDLRAI